MTDARLHCAVDITGAGTVTAQYGFYCDTLTKGASNYAFYSAGSTPSKFGGNVDVGGLSVGGVDATGAWTAWTPTIGSTVGAITAKSGAGRYKKIGKTVIFGCYILVTTNGTGSDYLTFTLPFPTSAASSAAAIQFPFAGFKFGGIGLAIITGPGTNIGYIRKYDGTYPVTSGDQVWVSGTYETD